MLYLGPPLKHYYKTDEDLQADCDAYVNLILNSLPATDKRLKQLQQAQEKDDTCKLLFQFCKEGWPSKLHGPVKQFKPCSAELLLRGTRIVIPQSIRTEILQKLHSGHQGITKCCDRAKQSVWWPGISKQIEETVQKCLRCCQHLTQRAETLLPTVFPDYLWQKVEVDLFAFKGSSYLLLIDYYSRYVEMSKMHSTTSAAVIQRMKSIFARHGIAEILISDNGPQFAAEIFTQFAQNFDFQHQTSSPNFPQGNGEIERAVKTVKSMLEKATDHYIGLLSYRTTPLANSYSPAE